VSYTIGEAAQVSLEVFNLKGQKVETLVEEHQLPGNYSASWNAENYCSGVYFYRLTAGDCSQLRKMLLLK